MYNQSNLFFFGETQKSSQDDIRDVFYPGKIIHDKRGSLSRLRNGVIKVEMNIFNAKHAKFSIFLLRIKNWQKGCLVIIAQFVLSKRLVVTTKMVNHLFC